MDLPKPMLATPSASTRSRNGVDLDALGTDWAFEEKLDGVRAYVVRRGGLLSIINRNGVDITLKFPELWDGPSQLQSPDGHPWAPKWPDGDFWFDGEIVADKFQTVNTRCKQPDRTAASLANLTPEQMCWFVAFDVPDYADLPYDQRRKILAMEMEPLSIVRAGDRSLIEELAAAGAEGVIAKQGWSGYQFGARSKSWIKFKNLHSVSCIGIGYNPGQGAREDFGALRLGMWTDATCSAVVEVGTCGTGFSVDELADMKRLLDEGAFPVVEVECLNVTTPGRQLRFPVFRGVRSDVHLSACTADQLETIPSC